MMRHKLSSVAGIDHSSCTIRIGPGTAEFREDLESYLWAILLESIYSFDLKRAVPFPGFVKAGIRYGYMRYWKRERLRNHREIHIPDRITEDGEVTFGMDIFRLEKDSGHDYDRR